MDASLAEVIVFAVTSWAAVGLVVAIPFVLKGAQRIDPAARSGTWGFRLAILPGSAALWPLVLRRWLGARQAPAQQLPEERSAHRRAARTP
ncbi:MAG: hypothetical protein ACI9EF_001753 [Pseudohongiellaceae bacterium]|jgi:hypothetical protein